MRRSLGNVDVKGSPSRLQPRIQLPLAQRYRRGRTNVTFMIFIGAGLLVSWNLDQLMHSARAIIDMALSKDVGGIHFAWQIKSTHDRNVKVIPQSHTARSRITPTITKESPSPFGHHPKDILAPCPPGFFVLGLARHMLHRRSRENFKKPQAMGFYCTDGGCSSHCGGAVCSSAAACGRQIGLEVILGQPVRSQGSGMGAVGMWTPYARCPHGFKTLGIGLLFTRYARNTLSSCVQSFRCNHRGCKAHCTNAPCSIAAQCVHIGDDTGPDLIRGGTFTVANGKLAGGQANCGDGDGYVAIGVGELQLEDGQQLLELGCDGATCWANTIPTGALLRARCVRSAGFEVIVGPTIRVVGGRSMGTSDAWGGSSEDGTALTTASPTTLIDITDTDGREHSERCVPLDAAVLRRNVLRRNGLAQKDSKQTGAVQVALQQIPSGMIDVVLILLRPDRGGNDQRDSLVSLLTNALGLPRTAILTFQGLPCNAWGTPVFRKTLASKFPAETAQPSGISALLDDEPEEADFKCCKPKLMGRDVHNGCDCTEMCDALSHLAAIKSMFDRGVTRLLLLEDTACPTQWMFDKSTQPLLQWALRDRNWRFLKLEKCHATAAHGGALNEWLTPRQAGYSSCSAAYTLTGAGAKALMTHAFPLRHTMDQLLWETFGRTASPLIESNNGGASDTRTFVRGAVKARGTAFIMKHAIFGQILPKENYNNGGERGEGDNEE